MDQSKFYVTSKELERLQEYLERLNWHIMEIRVFNEIEDESPDFSRPGDRALEKSNPSTGLDF